MAHRGKRLLNDIYNGTASGGFIETTKYLIEKHQDLGVKVLALNKGCKKTFELFPDIDNDEDYVWSEMRFCFCLGGECIDRSNYHRTLLRHALTSGKYNYVQEMFSYHMAKYFHRKYQLTPEYVQHRDNKIIVETAKNGQVES